MVRTVLAFRFILCFLQLLNCLLEILLIFFLVLFSLVFLFLVEGKFIFPQCFFLIKFTLDFSINLLNVIVLFFPFLNLSSNAHLSFRQSHLKLITLLLKFHIFKIISFYKILLLFLKVFKLFMLNSFFSFLQRLRLLNLLIKLL